MPWRPKKPCAQPGCAALVPAGQARCPLHARQQRQESEARRPNASQRGYNWRWQQYRHSYLVRNPLCADPFGFHKGQPVPAVILDHIKPVTGADDPLFWAESNHQGLCRSCHQWKTNHQDGGFGNPRKTRRL
jgi:5-methylcytosine-specific restriction protein A